MSSYTVEAVTKPLTLTEGPHWDQYSQVLYFVDLHGSTIHKYDPRIKNYTSTSKFDGGYVTFIIPVKGEKNKFAIAIKRDLFIMTWDTESCTPSKMERILTIEMEPEKSGNRFNDAKADPCGQLWAGTMGPELSPGVFPKDKGALYSISEHHTVTPLLQNVGISNGLAWSKDLKNFYYVDSMILEVFQFDIDQNTRELLNRRSVFSLAENCVKGFPDGMTIDTEDKLWVACYGPGEVIQIDPKTGKLIQRISIPAPNVTSVTFGGCQLDELYVTTGITGMTPEQQKQFPCAGALFKVTGLNAKGFPGTPVTL